MRLRSARMSAVDAQWYWMSPTMRSDQFLLYGFATASASLEEIAAQVRTHAVTIDDLCRRVDDVPVGLDRPYWGRAPVTEDQVRLTHGPMTWQSCLDRVAASIDDQLDARQRMWRLHLYGPVSAPAGVPGDALVVAILQIAHALGDGRRSSAIARKLFGAKESGGSSAADPVDTLAVPDGRVCPEPLRRAATALIGALRLPVDTARMISWGAVAFGRHRRRPAPTTTGVGPTPINRPHGVERRLRTVTVPADALTARGRSVTVGALIAISIALSRYLGDPRTPVTVTLAVAYEGDRRPVGNLSRNDFRNVSINLRTDLDNLEERAAAIADAIVAARAAAPDPVIEAGRRAEHVTPAPLRILGARQAGRGEPPERIDGISVVSSVNRGPADLALGGGESVVTAGFPALSPVHGLNHGIHGIGGRVSISVIAAPDVCPDIDRYMALLSGAVAAGGGRITE
ncbi:hypothetical protein ACPXB3_08760 [Gordonia sp. DT219]|uniref:hypothetical protein n=1 Tax=Gordonia sp. DT219 TaxID=3416658 RepID=UPI003CF514A5